MRKMTACYKYTNIYYHMYIPTFHPIHIHLEMKVLPVSHLSWLAATKDKVLIL